MEFVTYEQTGHIAVMTINRPKALNALNKQVLTEINEVLDQVDVNTVRCMIVTGAGEKSFVAGADIGEMSVLNREEGVAWGKYGNDIFRKLETLPVPTIAAINGYCLGGGFEFALACDFRICSENAKFGAPESKLGVCCGFGGNIRLPRIVGKAWAKDILMTGRMVDAQEALRLNLVTRVVSQSQLMQAVDELCANLLNKGANVLDFIKRAVDYGTEMDLRSAAQFEAGLFGVISGTYDKREGMSAFLEKRTPEFQDR